MRYRNLVVLGFGTLVIGIVTGLLYLPPSQPTVGAQALSTPAPSPEIESKKERDMSAEKLKRVRQEMIDMVIAVRQMTEKEFPDWWLSQSSTTDPANQQGETGLRMYWKNGFTQFFLTIETSLDKDAALKFYRFGNSRISMGEGFPSPAIYGEQAVIIKNVKVNSTNTSVSLNFPNGRMVVRASMHNHQRSNKKNESDLLRMMEKIYPLLIAKENFDDV